MARGKKVFGNCHLCGAYGQLTWEHVPPQAAFNDRPLVMATIREALNLGPEDDLKGEISQRGAGAYTLCAKCNNSTGRWYGTAFADWSHQGMRVLRAAKAQPMQLLYPIRALPLKILKQVVTMFFSVNGPQFRVAQPELVRFALNPEARFLSPSFRFFVFYGASSRLRYYGLSGRFSFASPDEVELISEIYFPPFGYVMTLDSPPPDHRLCEITHFSHYTPRDYRDVSMRIPVLDTVSTLPGDYRSAQELYRDHPHVRRNSSDK